MTYKIEKNVPRPKPNSGPWRGKRKYPFDQMLVGDSFLCNRAISYKAITQAALAYGRAYNRNMKFSARKTPEGVRIWRIE